MGHVHAIRGAFFDFVDDPWKHVGSEADSARFFADGLLVVDDGRIADFGAYAEVRARNPGVAITHITDRLILPGFIDGHVHVPQTRVLGAYGEQLLPWLLNWVFPEEIKYEDRDYALEGTKRFFDNLVSSGTTTCQAFTTSSPVSTDVFFEEAARRNMRVIGGLTGIDRMAPDNMLNTPEGFHRDSKALIETHHRQGRNLYAITPRFAYGASPELMESCRRLKTEFPDCWVNTHISENPSEIFGVLRLHNPTGDYLDHDYLSVYERYGLVGPKFSGGHGVWLSDDEFQRIHDKDGSITFCPCSNLFLGSGLFRLGKATDPAHRIRLSFGTDVGGGNRFSMLNVLDEGYKVGMLNNAQLDGSVDPARRNLAEAERNKLSAYRAFYSVTLGGAHGLFIDEFVGNFMPGKEADFVVLDWRGGPMALEWHQELLAGPEGPTDITQASDLLFSLMVIGDDRSVDETWIMGTRAYKRS